MPVAAAAEKKLFGRQLIRRTTAAAVFQIQRQGQTTPVKLHLSAGRISNVKFDSLGERQCCTVVNGIGLPAHIPLPRV